MLFQIYGENAGFQLLGWALVFVGLIAANELARRSKKGGIFFFLALPAALTVYFIAIYAGAAMGAEWALNNPTYTHNYGLIERDLMQGSEISRMPKDEALVLINGAQAFKDKKYVLSSHPRASLLARAEKSGPFEFKRYRARREGELMET